MAVLAEQVVGQLVTEVQASSAAEEEMPETGGQKIEERPDIEDLEESYSCLDHVLYLQKKSVGVSEETSLLSYPFPSE